MLVGNSGGIELLPIKLFSILEHAALITPSFRDLKSLTTALLDTKEMYPLCILCFRLVVLFFASDIKIPDCDLRSDLTLILFVVLSNSL